MFDNYHIRKYLFISSVLINLLVIALVFLPKETGKKEQEKVESEEKVAQVIKTPEPSIAGVAEELYLVSRVVDGDTIVLDNGQKVRYIGIDSPENTKETECYGQEAYQANKELVEGKMIRLVKDISETDKYGRLLRYVYVSKSEGNEEIFVNLYLVKEGYAKVSTYPPDVKYQQVFLQAEREAFAAKKGLWSGCGETNEVTVSPNVFTAGSCKYACDSPDRDCAEFITQQEAQEFFDCCGFTAENDPMKLDSTKVDDGVPCESLP